MIAIKTRMLSLFIVALLAACSSTGGLVKKTPEPTPESKKVDLAEKDSVSHSTHDEGAFHIVGPDETLGRICHVYGLDVAKVAKINKITSSETPQGGRQHISAC